MFPKPKSKIISPQQHHSLNTFGGPNSDVSRHGNSGDQKNISAVYKEMQYMYIHTHTHTHRMYSEIPISLPSCNILCKHILRYPFLFPLLSLCCISCTLLKHFYDLQFPCNRPERTRAGLCCCSLLSKCTIFPALTRRPGSSTCLPTALLLWPFFHSTLQTIRAFGNH